MFEKFKKGIIGTDYETVYVGPTAHPHVLAEVIHFTHLKNVEIRFTDSNRNVMTLFPREERVKTFFWSGDHLAQYIPSVYTVYDIAYKHEASMTDAELNIIFRLFYAEALTLTSDRYFHLSADLKHRIAGMKRMFNLKRLVLNIAEPSDLQLQLRPFLVIPPTIHEILFILPKTMAVNRRILFAANQKYPRPWSLKSDLDVHWIAFKKRRIVERLPSMRTEKGPDDGEGPNEIYIK